MLWARNDLPDRLGSSDLPPVSAGSEALADLQTQLEELLNAVLDAEAAARFDDRLDLMACLDPKRFADESRQRGRGGPTVPAPDRGGSGSS